MSNSHKALSHLISILALFLIVACSDHSKVAGGAIDIGNPSIAGSIKDEQGKAIAEARVRLLPSDYNAANGDSGLRETVSNGQGMYHFAKVEPRTYTVEARNLNSSLVGINQNILVVRAPTGIEPDTIGPGPCILRNPSTIEVPLNSSTAIEGGFISLPGTSISHKITASDLALGKITLRDVPADTYQNLFFLPHRGGASISLLSNPLDAQPGQEIKVGPYGPWKHSFKIFINTSATGGNIAEDLHGFPLLIRLDSTVFDFSYAEREGKDLRFTGSDRGKVLPFEIERWDSINRKAEVWVKVDTIRGGNDSQYIVLYCGNDTASSQGNSKAVFDSASGFAAVWHLAENAVPPQQLHRDASVFNNQGQGAGLNPPYRVEAAIGMAQQFDGTGFITVPDNNALDLSKITLSAWIKADSLGGRVIDKTTASDSDGYNLDTFEGRIRICGSPFYYTSNTQLPLGRLVHIAVTFDGTFTRFYLDGKPDGETDSLLSLPTNALPLHIGAASDETHQFLGQIDEARVSSQARSGAWIKLEFENQKPLSRLLRFH